MYSFLLGSWRLLHFSFSLDKAYGCGRGGKYHEGYGWGCWDSVNNKKWLYLHTASPLSLSLSLSPQVLLMAVCLLLEAASGGGQWLLSITYGMHA